MKELVCKWKIVIYSILFAVVGRGFDILSSLHMPTWAEETNPLTRHPFTHAFWLAHALVVSGTELLEMALYAAVLYLVARLVAGERLAKVAACLPYLAMGMAGFIAGIHNELLYKLWCP